MLVFKGLSEKVAVGSVRMFDAEAYKLWWSEIVLGIRKCWRTSLSAGTDPAQALGHCGLN